MATAILPKVWGEGAENFGASFQGAALGRRPGIIVSGLLRQARYWKYCKRHDLTKNSLSHELSLLAVASRGWRRGAAHACG